MQRADGGRAHVGSKASPSNQLRTYAYFTANTRRTPTLRRQSLSPANVQGTTKHLNSSTQHREEEDGFLNNEEEEEAILLHACDLAEEAEASRCVYRTEQAQPLPEDVRAYMNTYISVCMVF